jgi:HK97 family phage prohead protease
MVRENEKTPIPVLFAHKMDELPVGTTTALAVSDAGIRASWRWLEGDDRADRVRRAFEQGILTGASIGFRPIEREPNKSGGWIYRKWSLLEWSLCAIPSNPFATRQLKQLGLLEDTMNEYSPAEIRQMIARAMDGAVGRAVQQQLTGKVDDDSPCATYRTPSECPAGRRCGKRSPTEPESRCLGPTGGGRCPLRGLAGTAPGARSFTGLRDDEPIEIDDASWSHPYAIAQRAADECTALQRAAAREAAEEQARFTALSPWLDTAGPYDLELARREALRFPPHVVKLMPLRLRRQLHLELLGE